MKRFIPQFIRQGFPELYAVRDTFENCIIGEPKLYHEANDECDARNNGVFGQAQSNVDIAALYAGWAVSLPDAP